MDNEVVIHVRVDDDSRTGFASAQANANKTASDIEGAFKRSSNNIRTESKRTGEGVGGSIIEGITRFSPKMASAITDVAGIAGKAGGPLLAAGLAVGLPLIGASISGAIVGGVGIGGVLGGVALASQDARVAAAGKVLGNNLMTGLKQDASVFVGPVLEGINKIQSRFETLRPTLQNIFRNSSNFLDPLLDGALDGITALMAGVDVLIGNAGPVIDAFGGAFKTLGESIGEAMATISGGSEDAATAITFLADGLGQAIVNLGRLIRVLTETWGFLHDATLETISLGEANTALAPTLERSADGARRLGSGTFGAAESMGFMQKSAEEMTFSLEDAEKAVNAVYQANNNLYSSTTNVAEAMARATKTIKQNGQTLSLNTEAGRENRNALSSVAGQLQRNYDAYVKVNGVGEGSSRVANNLRGQFVRLATAATGSSREANRLADSLLNIPRNTNPRVTLQGGRALSNEVKDMRNRINSLPRSKTITVHVSVTGRERLDSLGHRIGGYKASGGVVGAGGMAHGGIKGAADGATSSGMTLVGEYGPELVDLPPGTSVKSNPDTMRIMSGGGGGNTTGGQVPVVLNVDGRLLVEVLADPIRNYVRSYQGQVQNAFGG